MNRTAVITGASRGIGAAAARRLAGLGYRLTLGYNNSGEQARALLLELEAAGAEVALYRGDVAERGAAEGIVNAAVSSGGRIDLLINNAGISQFSLFQDISPQDWRRMFAVNVDSVYYTSRAAVPVMIRQKSGVILNVSSVWGITGASCETHYSASKAAVIGFTKALAKELAPSGIRVNCVAPGAVGTDMNARLTAEERAGLEKEIPMGRMGTPEEIADVIAFLAGDGARYITGQVISPNGGLVI